MKLDPCEARSDHEGYEKADIISAICFFRSGPEGTAAAASKLDPTLARAIGRPATEDIRRTQGFRGDSHRSGTHTKIFAGNSCKVSACPPRVRVLAAGAACRVRATTCVQLLCPSTLGHRRGKGRQSPRARPTGGNFLVVLFRPAGVWFSCSPVARSTMLSVRVSAFPLCGCVMCRLQLFVTTAIPFEAAFADKAQASFLPVGLTLHLCPQTVIILPRPPFPPLPSPLLPSSSVISSRAAACSLRVILDARRGNRRFHVPPSADLLTGEGLSRVEMTDNKLLWLIASSGIQNAFRPMLLKKWLARYFCLPRELLLVTEG